MKKNIGNNRLKNMSKVTIAFTVAVALITPVSLNITQSMQSVLMNHEHNSCESSEKLLYNLNNFRVDFILDEAIDDDSVFLPVYEHENLFVGNIPDFTSGCLLIKFKPGIDVSTPEKALKAVRHITTSSSSFTSVSSAKPLFSRKELSRNAEQKREFGFDRYVIVEFEKDDINILYQAQKFRQNTNVEYAEMNYIAQTQHIPNDPRIDEQWSLENIQAFNAWDIEKSSSDVVIAVIDSGADYTHEDLQDNIHPVMYDFVEINPDEYINEGFTLVPGEDYLDEDDDPMDFNGHGTHCAGIAAARGDNSIGVSGICLYSSIMAVRAGFEITHPINGNVGILEYDDIAQAIVFAVDNGAQVISMSFGGSSDSALMHDAIIYAYANNVILVASAGNLIYESALPSYPARYDEVIAVAATAQDDSRSWYSNYGSWIDVAAPGGDEHKDTMILSTVPISGGFLSDPSGYRFLQGASMACPYVAGLAALVMSNNTNWSRNRIISQIVASTDYFDFYGEEMGSGRINAYQALNSTYNETKIDLHGFSINEMVGNGDGQADAGEEIEVIVKLKNYFGISYGVEATLQTDDPYVTMINTAASFSDLYYWDYTNNSNEPFVFEISLDCPRMHTIEFIINITANNGTYETQDTFKVPVSLYIPGWPVTIDSTADIHPVVGDVDGDSDIEIVVGSPWYLYVFHGNGSLVEGWPQNHPGTYISPALGDLDNDGKLEVVRTTTNGRLYAWDNNGTLLPNFPVFVGANPGQVSLTDLDKDNDLEILFTQSQQDNNNVYAFHHNGSLVEGWPVDVGTEIHSYYMCTTVGDITGDDFPEIIIGTYNAPYEVYAWEYNGSLVEGWPVSVEGSIKSPASLGDINDDEQLEIFIASSTKIYGFYGNGTLISGWPQWGGGPPVLGDLDDDGDLEIICPSNGDIKFAYHHNGTPVSGWPVFSENSMYWDAQIVDINNDGDIDVVARDNSNKIFAWHHTGDPVENYPIIVGIETPGEWGMESSLAFADIDRDGSLDMVTGSDYSDDNIYAYDLPTVESPESIDWGMYRNDMQHTGVYTPLNNNPPYIPGNPKPEYGAFDVSIDADLSWAGGDPDTGDTVTYDVYFDTSNPPEYVDMVAVESYNPGILDYATMYYWKIVARDDHGHTTDGAIWNFTTEEDKNPPNVKILRPEKAFYIKNKKILTLFLLKPIIIGSIDIEVEVSDDLSGINRVEFYIDDIIVGNDTTEPYSYIWDGRTIFRFLHTINVIAYDNVENSRSDEIMVWKFP